MTRAVAGVWLMALSGCLPMQVRRADSLAASGDWEQALPMYEQALGLRPANRTIHARVGHARDMVAQARAEEARMERLRGEQALLVGDLDTALLALHAARAILPNDPDIEHALLRAAEAAMSMAGERLSSEGPLVAYPFAMRAARFGVHVPGLPELVAATRGGVEEQVRGLIEAGAFEQAHVQVATVRAWEPALGETWGRMVDEAWAESLALEAAQFGARGQLAEAWLTMAKAVQRHAEEGHVAELARWRTRVIEDWRVDLHLPRARTEAGARLQQAALRSARAAGFLESGDGILELGAWKATERCANTERSEERVHRYVSGTREVDNPERREALAAAAAQRADLPELRVTLAEREADLAEADARIRRAEDTWRMYEDAALRAEDREADVRQDYERVQAMLRDAESRAALEGDMNSLEVARLQEQLAIEESALRRAADEARTARRRAEDARGELVDAESTRARARTAAREAREELAEDTAESERLEARALAMPEQITEEVWADWVYPVTVVTRTCSLRGSAVLSVDGRSMPQAFSRSVQVQDTVHAGHGAVGLSADPLEFGREDVAMLGALHEEVAHSLVSVASEQRTRLYAAMPHSGELDARVAVLLLDPSAGDSLWLASSWGLDPSDL